MWHGSPISAGMRERSVTAESIACRFEECRLRAYAGLVDALCAGGDPGAVLGDLHQLVAEHPRRESAHALLIRALYETGDAAAALGAYQRLRRLLSGELGVEPSLHLRHLHQAVLQGRRVTFTWLQD
ncbi:AfsR/SARP family transcriptional regulator [Paractinoplanes globisporus]|uniref:AfsR/SARP family transcriptional regulator n=1 Tax=Paractinoplanes globisporus TaxID=113565 RepID=A0ABW6W6R3_9ACTN|nr:AfsR/SARP family transcriptional regulator [Actinoplanes globisporus]